MRKLFEEDKVYADLRKLDRDLLFARKIRMQALSANSEPGGIADEDRDRAYNELPDSVKKSLIEKRKALIAEKKDSELNPKDKVFDMPITECYIQFKYRTIVDHYEKHTAKDNQESHDMYRQFVVKRLRDESTENLVLILRDESMSLELRKALFASLETQQQEAIFAEKDSGISIEDKIQFLEFATLSLAQKKTQTPMAAIAALSIASLIVVASLVIAGPLGGVLSIGALGVTSIFLHLAATRLARFAAARALQVDIEKQLKDPNLSNQAKVILEAELEKAKKEQRQVVIEVGMMLVVAAVLLVTPPPITLGIGAICIAYTVGKILDKYAKTIHNPYLRHPLRFIANFLQFPISGPLFVAKKTWSQVNKTAIHFSQNMGDYKQLSTNDAHSHKESGKKAHETFVKEELSDSVKEEFKLAGVQRSFEVVGHVGSTSPSNSSGFTSHTMVTAAHFTLGVFDLFSAANTVRSYFRHQKQKKTLAKLTRQLASEEGVEKNTSHALKVGRLRDIQDTLLYLKDNLKVVDGSDSHNLDKKMKDWNDTIENKFSSQPQNLAMTTVAKNTKPGELDAAMQKWHLKHEMMVIESKLNDATVENKQALKDQLQDLQSNLGELEKVLPSSKNYDLLKDHLNRSHANDQGNNTLANLLTADDSLIGMRNSTSNLIQTYARSRSSSIKTRSASTLSRLSRP